MTSSSPSGLDRRSGKPFAALAPIQNALNAFARAASKQAAIASSFVRSLSGWRRAGVAWASGAVVALSFAPVYLWPALFIGLPVFIWLIDGAGDGRGAWRRAAWSGFWFGFGYFLIGVYWMSFSLFVDAASFAWLAPFAITLLPAGLAVFLAAAAGAARLFWSDRRTRILAFAAAWSVFEFARGHILTGLPWNLLGQAWAGGVWPSQVVAFTGVYGLSFLTLLAACAPAALARASGRAEPPHRGALLVILPVAGVVALYALGGVRLASIDVEDNAEFTVRIVQPNIAQRDKVNPDKQLENFHRLLVLTGRPFDGRAPDLVVWPENAAPFIDLRAEYRRLAADAMPKGGILAAGGVRVEYDELGDARYFNSLQMVQGDAVLAAYDKHKLVPFGEFLPLSGLLRRLGLDELTNLPGGFEPGPGPSVVEVAGVPAFAPLICYESIFARLLYPRDNRPGWLLNITNDGWFGDSSGPRQHLAQARLRAIETGLPLVRSANTGISAVIDPAGRYVERLPLYTNGVIDASLPAALPATLYARLGDAVFFLFVLAAIACVAFTQNRTNNLQP